MSRFLLLFAVCHLSAMVGNPREARAQSVEVLPTDNAPILVMPTPEATAAYPVAVLPAHVSVGNQRFDASVAGLRAFLETTRSTNPQLYAQLAPDIDRLESRATAARIVLITGLGVGVASTVFALVGRTDCMAPSVDDPAFSEKAAAWGACNRNNMRTMMTFALVGLGSMIAGGIGWLALSPGRSDVFDLVNRHNRLSPEPMRFQIGYDPAGRLAYGGAALTF